jgi:hypothetical protein
MRFAFAGVFDVALSHRAVLTLPRHATPLAAALAASVLMGAAHAQVSVSDAWVRATVPQQQATAAFMQITAPQPMRLVGVQTEAAQTAEIHTMERQGDVMRMKAISGVDLPAGQAVALTPGGQHLMLMGLKTQQQAGQTVNLVLKLQTAEGKTVQQTVAAQVRPLGAGAASDGQGGHGQGGQGAAQAAPAHQHAHPHPHPAGQAHPH